MASVSTLSRRVGVGLAVLAVLGAMGWVLTRTGPLAPVKVTQVAVAQGTVSPRIMGIGTVEARRGWAVGPTAAGRVLRVLADVGDHVQAGALLAEMDPVDLDARVQALDAARARAVSAQQTAQAQVADATARRVLAQANWQRNQDLARQSFISAGALEGRQQELASAQAALQAAQSGVAGAGQDVARLQAERQALVQQRGTVRLLAPAAAVVTARDVEPGTAVVAGQAVLRLVDPDSLWVKVRFDQGRAAGLAQGQAAQVVLRSQAHTPLAGRVARLELLADAVTEERLAQVTLEAGMPLGASVGEMVEVTVQLPLPPAGLVLPNASVQRQRGQTGVWRLAASGLQWVPVAVVATGLDGRVQVRPADTPADPPAGAGGAGAGDTAPLAEGDRVVVHSQKVLTAGTRVQVVDALVPGAGPAAGGAK